MAVDDDNYFELMIRNALMPSENENGIGKFSSTHATARRVLVVHSNGVEEIVGQLHGNLIVLTSSCQC